MGKPAIDTTCKSSSCMPKVGEKNASIGQLCLNLLVASLLKDTSSVHQRARLPSKASILSAFDGGQYTYFIR